MKKLTLATTATALLLLAAGCTPSDPPPVEGDNPASANAATAPADRTKNDVPRNTLPEGMGRTGGGSSAGGAAGR